VDTSVLIAVWSVDPTITANAVVLCVPAGDKSAIGVENLAEFIADAVERAARERTHLVLERGPHLYARFYVSFATGAVPVRSQGTSIST
jgi:hypothetical protein